MELLYIMKGTPLNCKKGKEQKLYKKMKKSWKLAR